jgi:Ran GTPase-activating protein (RanGAP) involved in mRNA processing and transport
LVGSKGVIAIAKSLGEGHELLEELDLSYDEFGDSAAVELSKAIKDKKNLKRLELNGNKMKSEGIEAIKKILEDNKLVETLGSLSENDEEEEEEARSDDEGEEEDD